MRRLPEGLDDLFALLQRRGHQLLLGAGRALDGRVNRREDALAAAPAADDALHHFFDYFAYVLFADVWGHSLYPRVEFNFKKGKIGGPTPSVKVI